jgi:hypothetical protein
MVMRHSIQMPMPQSAARGSPCTEYRQGSPAIITAAATLVPSSTSTCLPLMVMEIRRSFNCVFLPEYASYEKSCGKKVKLFSIAYEFVYQ